MDLENAFERIGARARVYPIGHGRVWRQHGIWRRLDTQPLAVDVVTDRRGERFSLGIREDASLEVLAFGKRTPHLLLLGRANGEKPRYLCGLDDGHWFVAAIPEVTPVSSVSDAMLALRPEIPVGGGQPSVRKRLAARASVVLRRQGEWFFHPAPAFDPGRTPIRRWEPLRRGAGSTPHLAWEGVRTGGTTVWVPISIGRTGAQAADAHRQVGHLNRPHDEDAMRRLERRYPSWTWRPMTRDPELYVRGPIRHPDHATLRLREWHRVYLNTEPLARAGAHLVFLD